MPDKALSDKDRKSVTEDLRKMRELIKTLEDAGVEVPPTLTKALKALQIALDTGKDLGKAFDEASKAVANLEHDLMEACKHVDEEMQGVCEAKVARVYQARAVKFTLDYKNPDSVSAHFIKNTVQRYTPSLICKHWNYCKQQVQ